MKSTPLAPWRPLCIRGPGRIAIACVPKVAHTAIKDAVLRSRGIRIVKISRMHQHPALNLCQPREAIEQGYKVFAVVRDPFDRLVSVWAHRVRPGRHRFNRTVGASKDEPFDVFVRRLSPDLVRRNIHIATQVDFVPAGTTVLRYERLAEDWNEVQAAWPGMPDLRRINTSEHGLASDYASAEAMAICRHVYRDDYRAFGYV